MNQLATIGRLAVSAWKSPYALRLTPILILASVSLISVPLVESPTGTGAFISYLIPSLIALPPAFLVLTVAWWFTYRRGPQPVWMLFAIATASGATRGAALYFASDALVPSPQNLPDLANRFTTAILAWNITFASFAVLNYLVLTPTETWRKLRKELSEVETEISDSRQQLNWLVANQVAVVDAQLKSDFGKLEVLLANTSDSNSYENIAEELRKFIRASVQTKSREMWQPKLRGNPLTRAAKAALGKAEVAVGISITVYVLGYVINEIRIYGFSEGLISTVITSLILTAMLFAAKSIRSPRTRMLTVFLGIPVLQGIISYITYQLLLGERGMQYQLLTSLTAIIWAWISIFLASWYVTARGIFTQDIQDLSEARIVKEEQLHWLQTQTEAANREIAKYLHGVLQSRLLGHALQFEMKDANQADRLKALRATMSAPMQDFSLTASDLKAELTRAFERWNGFLQVEISDDSSFRDEVASTETLQVVQEALTNSLRHGEASKVFVRIQDKADVRIIEVSDDGKGSEGSPGLGSAIFDSVSNGRWELTRSPKGTVLHLELDLK